MAAATARGGSSSLRAYCEWWPRTITTLFYEQHYYHKYNLNVLAHPGAEQLPRPQPQRRRPHSAAWLAANGGGGFARGALDDNMRKGAPENVTGVRSSKCGTRYRKTEKYEQHDGGGFARGSLDDDVCESAPESADCLR